MTSQQNNLTKLYIELSSLYKNPTRFLGGMAASNQGSELDTELVNKHKKLLHLFEQERWDERAGKPALYFKILSLLYEIDDYRGVSPAVEELILREHSALIEQFDTRSKQHNLGAHQKSDFNEREVRSLWKAKALCCVAVIESRRKGGQSKLLLGELSTLAEFIKKNLHRPEDSLPAWTTLAFVCAAQARIARQSQMYSYMREKLLNVVQCLDERAAEIIERLSTLRQQSKQTKEAANEIENLADDLVFIRRKQTLSTSFNVGLAELQRGSLRFAAYACQAAQLEFRLHGQLFHRLFNELLMLSIKRAQISRDNKEEFLKLKDELERDIIPLLKTEGRAGNPRLYLYALREKVVIQYYCGKYDDMLKTLETMEKVGPSKPQWNSRISNQRARAYWRRWVEAKPKNEGLLRTALDYSLAAFRHASGLDEEIECYTDARSLLAGIEGSGRKSLVDTMESLITYGDVQIGLKNLFEATKSAATVIKLCKDNNPRLLAMGHLVMAEAHIENGLFIEANQHLASAKILESQIDHEYVADRIKAVEKSESMHKFLDLSKCTAKQFDKAEDLLLGWFIEQWSDMSSVNKVATDLGLNRKKILNFVERLDLPENRNSPYYYLRDLKDKYQNKRRERRKKL
jgi:hypothetical protein